MEKQKVATKENKKKKPIKFRCIAVFTAVLVFALVIGISIRGQYLDVIGIGEEYIDVFYQNIKNKYSVLGVSFVLIYLTIYITNKFIKKGLKKFFDDEKKEMPKLPNKSLCLSIALLGSILVSQIITEEFLLFANSAMFGRNDPIFGTDISFYVFKLPFIKSLIILLIESLIVLIVYVALYYVITLNTYLDGVDIETLKKNTFIKQEIFFVMLIAIIFAVYIIFSTQGIMTQNMLSIEDKASTELIGAGKSDVTIKLWGYRILAVILIFAVIRLIKYVKKADFKQSVMSAAIIPIYLVGLFIVMTCNDIIVSKNNEFDKEKEYIGYNIQNTREAFGISIDQKNIDTYKAITYDQVTSNSSLINNIPVISEDVTVKSVKEHQENSVYYSFENTMPARYKINDVNKMVYITPREITDDNMSYNNRTYKYTHGYSAVVSTATDSDKNGYTEYILSDFTESDKLKITEPRIYFGLNTNSSVAVNTDFGKEYDYPLTATNNEENVYSGKAGLKLNFIDKLVVGIRENNLKLAFSSELNKDSKIISNRNIIERAKVLLPNVLYDEEPYLVITDAGRLVWVLDGYTRTHNYPYSQKCDININGYKERLNYIRNSVKILIDAYDGTIKFYITDRDDPIIMAYANIFPTLFADSSEEIPADIQEHLIYPKFLYKIQASMINMYHEISEDALYRADDIWQITPNTAATGTSTAMEPYYTMLKTIDDDKDKFGLMLTFNKLGKQNITSYLVGSVENGKQKLSLYKFNSESNVIGIAELNNQIEQDATISAELEALNTIGTKLVKDMLIIPINNTLLYVEPVYQVRLNERESPLPILKKVIVASGNIVAIGDNIDEAITNLFTDYAVDLEFIDTEDITSLVDSVIKANNNLSESINASDFEMIGKDISKIQAIIKQLEAAREKEIEKEKQEKEEAGIGLPSIFGKDDENTIDGNTITNTTSLDVSNEVTNNITNSVSNLVK